MKKQKVRLQKLEISSFKLRHTHAAKGGANYHTYHAYCELMTLPTACYFSFL